MSETTNDPPPLRIRKKETEEEPRPDPVAQAKRRSRRQFFIGLLVGQILIVGLNFGLPWLLVYLKDQVAVSKTIPLGLLIFVGILGGLGITAVVIAILLFFAALKGAATGGSLLRGIGRLFKASAIIGFTAAVLGGTALLMIPTGQWKTLPRQVKELCVEMYNKVGKPEGKSP